jgi:hypothetical protein
MLQDKEQVVKSLKKLFPRLTKSNFSGAYLDKLIKGRILCSSEAIQM